VSVLVSMMALFGRIDEFKLEKDKKSLWKLEETNMISPVKHSKWAAHIVPVEKKDKSLRLCGI